MPRLPTLGHPRCLRLLTPNRRRSCIAEEGPLPRLLTSAMTTAPPAVSYRRTQVVHLPRGWLCHPSLNRQRPRRLRPSHTGAPRWCISGEGYLATPSYIGRAHVTSGHLLLARPDGESPGKVPLPRLPTSAKPTPPSYVSSGILPVVHFQGRGPCHASLHWHTDAASGRHFLTVAVGASPGMGPRHDFLHRNAHAASSQLLPADPGGASPGRGPCLASLHRQRPRRLRPSPTGAPS